jgi:hypothetical protein
VGAGAGAGAGAGVAAGATFADGGESTDWTDWTDWTESTDWTDWTDWTESMSVTGAGRTESGAPGELIVRSISRSWTLPGGVEGSSAPARAIEPKPAPSTAPPTTAAFQVRVRRIMHCLS